MTSLNKSLLYCLQIKRALYLGLYVTLWIDANILRLVASLVGDPEVIDVLADALKIECLTSGRHS